MVQEMKSAKLDGGEDGEHNGVTFMGTIETTAKQGAIFFGTKLPVFDRIYNN